MTASKPTTETEKEAPDEQPPSGLHAVTVHPHAVERVEVREKTDGMVTVEFAGELVECQAMLDEGTARQLVDELAEEIDATGDAPEGQ
jgi:hypothetical protein